MIGERLIYVPKGGDLKIVFEGGPTMDIKNASGSSIELKQIYPTSKGEQKDQVRAKLPSLVESYIQAAVAFDALTVTGGEVASGEYELSLAEDRLFGYFLEAKKAGIPAREMEEDIDAILRRINIGQLKDGIMGPSIRKVDTKLYAMINEALRTEEEKKG